MATMGCQAFLDQLDSWIEGRRTPEARAHLADCSGCRNLAEDLTAIAATARSMAEAPEPPAHLWNSIRTQLEHERIILPPQPAALPECQAFVDQLDSWMEGVRTPEARAHLAQCGGCSSLADDFAAITSTARSLAHDLEPPAYLWNSIRAQLAREGIIREQRPLDTASPRRWPEWLAMPRPALAGAFLAILVVAGLAVRGPVTRRINDYRWMRGTQRSTVVLAAQLNTVEHSTVTSLRSDPAVEAALHKNLAIVDNYISLCEKSVREDPQNEMARDFLYGAYQQKADLLAQINEQGE